MINANTSPIQRKNLTLVVLAYLAVYIIWGSTYFFIKISVQTIPPFISLGLRFLVGGLLFLFLAFAFSKRRIEVSFRQILTSAGLGLLLLIGGTGLVTIAETKVDSYLAALIIASTPLAVSLFDLFLFRKKLSLFAAAGIIAGVAGVGFLLYNGSSTTPSFTREVLLVVLALTLWSLGTSLGHKLKTIPDTFLNSAIQMLAAALFAICFALVTGPSLVLIVPHFSGLSLFAVLYLAVLGSLGFVSYSYLIQNEPAIRVATYAFVNPVIALFLGLALGGEKAVPLLGIGLPLILFGLFLMFYGETFFRNIGERLKKGKVRRILK